MTSDLLLDSPHPNYLVASAFYEAYPDGNIILRPEAVDGLAESFTVIHVGHVDDGVQYLVGLYGEHDLENPPLNPMNMEPLVLGLILVNGQLTVTDALPLEEFPEPVTCCRVATLVHDNDMYYCYVGESANKDGGVTEYFLLIVQVIGDEFFSLDVDDQELWSTLTRTLLQGCGIEPEEDDEEVTETGDDSEPDFS
jgi:hypothetical protein